MDNGAPRPSQRNPEIETIKKSNFPLTVPLCYSQ
jgi:hypothetical protein